MILNNNLQPFVTIVQPLDLFSIAMINTVKTRCTLHSTVTCFLAHAYYGLDAVNSKMTNSTGS